MCRNAKESSKRFNIDIITNEWETIISGLLEGK